MSDLKTPAEAVHEILKERGLLPYYAKTDTDEELSDDGRMEQLRFNHALAREQNMAFCKKIAQAAVIARMMLNDERRKREELY